jgi:5'-phosphate synthase pdxT subunit
MKIGVLAIQGDFEQHEKRLKEIEVDSLQVKTRSELERCDGLILPGGETTTLRNLLQWNGLYEAIHKFDKPIFGTCAGAILLAREIDGIWEETLGLIDITVKRNAYGRQIHSFEAEGEAPFLGNGTFFQMVFIRAPIITRLGEGTESLATYKGDVVMSRNDKILVTTFHPELTPDVRIHQYFVDTFVRKGE